MEQEYSTIGRHVTCDIWGVDFDKLNDLESLKKLVLHAALASGATVLEVRGRFFDPQGVTVFALLQESHMSIHTYPLEGFAALDCYTCGHTVNPEVAIDFALEQLKPNRIRHKVDIRGVDEDTELVYY